MDIEGMPEDERFRILQQIETERPGSATLAGGKLGGRATPDRPDVPIWQYQRHADTHPEVALDDLVSVRFPVIFYGGVDSTIDSAAEYLRTDPIPPSTPFTLDNVIDMWAWLHAAGVVRWESARRAVEHVRPFTEYRAALEEWRAARLPAIGPGAEN